MLFIRDVLVLDEKFSLLKYLAPTGRRLSPPEIGIISKPIPII